MYRSMPTLLTLVHRLPSLDGSAYAAEAVERSLIVPIIDKVLSWGYQHMTP